MRRATMVVMLGLTGCGNLLPFPARGPQAIQASERTLPHSIRYEVLEQTSATSCASPADLAVLETPKTVDPATVGNAALFEQAKFEAIRKVKGADGLVAISAKVERKNGDECVTVQGRSYAIRAMRAGDVIDERTQRPASTNGTNMPDGTE